MALNKIKTSSIEDDSITSVKLAPGAVTNADIPNSEITMDKLSQVDLTIAPEVLEIQVDAPAAGQDSAWLWTWLTSSLPYARRTITNSPEISVPLYKQGTYTVNNYAAYDLHGSMTQTHTLYFKWIDGAGTDNLISWATSTGPVSDSHPDINGGAATNVQRINIAVPGTVTPPTLTAPNVSYTVTNNGTGAYTFSGSASGDNPNIGPFYRGGTYTFNVSAVGHPLYFTTDNGTNFSAGTYFGEYTTGVTGSRTDNGTVTITVDASAPNTLYYQCGNHSSMRGVITVKDLAVETNINGNYIVYAQHTQEGHKTPIEIRPIPSLVNQMCLVYDASVGKFVPQDLATYVENTPSFENKIREVAGTAELVVEDGSAVIAKVNVYDDSTYLPLVGNNPGDQAFATDTDILYIWDGTAWQQAGASNSDDLTEGTTNLFYTDARVQAVINTNTAGFITSADGGNAATVDGLDSTQFLRSDADDTTTGSLTISGNLVVDGDFVRIPVATSDPAGVLNEVEGNLYFHSTFGLMQYLNGQWQKVATLPPSFTSVDTSNINEGDTTQTLVITGSNLSGSSAILIDNNGTELPPTTSVANSDTQITITYSGGDLLTESTPEPLDIKLIGPTGLTTTVTDAIYINASPNWITSGGSLGTVYEDVTINTINVSATDPEGSSISYSITGGALPTGLSLSSTGNITGTPNVNDSYNAGGVTHNFTVGATDGTNTTPRAFSILRKWLDGSSSAVAVNNALDLVNLGITTDGLYWIDIPNLGATQVYCDLNTNGGGWMHAGTFADNNENAIQVASTSQQSGGVHPWGAPLFPAQDCGIWQDNSTLGSQSFTSDFKHGVWANMPMSQFLMKDQGTTRRNLFYTNSGQISTQTLSSWFGSLSWAAQGSEVASSAYSNGRVTGLNITNFGVSDPVLDSGNKSVMLFKFGESDGVQDGNKDRSMIASHPWNAGQNVDGPSGIGCFRSADPTQSGWYQRYRDIVPIGSGYPDEPPLNISGAPYQYSIWVR